MDFLQKLHAAQNPNTPIKTLELLASDEDFYVRARVSGNPNISPEILETLATDEYYLVRHYVAQNPNRNELIERLVLMTDHLQSSDE